MEPGAGIAVLLTAAGLAYLGARATSSFLLWLIAYALVLLALGYGIHAVAPVPESSAALVDGENVITTERRPAKTYH